MFDNALLYNRPGTFHNKYAQNMLKNWLPRIRAVMTETLGMGRCAGAPPPCPSGPANPPSSAHAAPFHYCCGERRRLSGFTYRCRGGTCFVRYGISFWRFDPDDGEDEIIFCQVSRALPSRRAASLGPQTWRADPLLVTVQSHYQRLAPTITIPRFGNGSGDDISFPKEALTKCGDGETTPTHAARSLPLAFPVAAM